MARSKKRGFIWDSTSMPSATNATIAVAITASCKMLKPVSMPATTSMTCCNSHETPRLTAISSRIAATSTENAP